MLALTLLAVTAPLVQPAETSVILAPPPPPKVAKVVLAETELQTAVPILLLVRTLVALLVLEILATAKTTTLLVLATALLVLQLVLLTATPVLQATEL
jgi:hypothetical protein